MQLGGLKYSRSRKHPPQSFEACKCHAFSRNGKEASEVGVQQESEVGDRVGR